MKMKHAMMMGLAAMNAYAQADKGGNGGAAWVCRDANKKITRIELVDLWEAENDPALKMKINRSDIAVDEQIAGVLNALEQKYKDAMMPVIEDTKSLIKIGKVGKNVKVTVINDAAYSIEPQQSEFCGAGNTLRYEQIVNYRDDGTILVDEALFNNELFSNTDKAALYVHEAVYAQDRDSSSAAQDSRRARKVTGRLFSETGAIKDTLRTLGYLFLGEKYNFVSQQRLKDVRSVDFIFTGGRASAVITAWETKEGVKPESVVLDEMRNVDVSTIANKVLSVTLWHLGGVPEAYTPVTVTIKDSETGKVLARFKEDVSNSTATGETLGKFSPIYKNLKEGFVVIHMNQIHFLEN